MNPAITQKEYPFGFFCSSLFIFSNKLKQFSRHKTDAALKRYIHLTEKDLKKTSAFEEIKDVLV